jgi:hypothetical protein
MYDSPTGHAVRTTLVAIAENRGRASDDLHGVLKDRVYAAVDELTALGWPIERIIVRLKDLTKEIGRPLREELTRDVVRWCIDRHFDKKPSA